MVVRSASRRGRCGESRDRRRARRPHHRGCCGRRQGWSRDAAISRAWVAFCSTMAIAMPSRLICRMVSNSVSAAIGDSPAEGSSSSSSTGCTISAIAIARIWRCPPDSVRAARPRRSASTGKRANTSSMRWRVAAGSSQPPISRFSRTDSVAKMFCSCGTKATPRRDTSRGDKPCIGSPRNRMLPWDGCSRPAMVFNRVDLPAPFGPMMAMISWSWTARCTPLRISSPRP